MENMIEKVNALEALLFACDEPLENEQLCTLLAIDAAVLDEVIEGLKARYVANSGLDLKRIDTGLILVVNKNYNDYVKQLRPLRNTKLSRAAMETLSIVAFRQPITRLEVSDLRGVKSDGVIAMLLMRGLIEIVGRKEALGRPILYGTTAAFLQYFGLDHISDLPKPEGLKF